MASETQELKQLNKSVSEAVNILKAFGNIAQMKAKSEEEKEILSKWFEVAEDQKKQTKRQRAFTERARDAQGKFISNQSKSASKFMDMTKVVGGMFSKMTVGVTTSIKSFTSGLMNNFSSFFQAVKNQFLGLFGEESEWFELLGSIKDSIVNVTGSVINFLFKRTPAWAGKQIKVLKAMYNLQLKQMKMDFLDAAGTKKKKFGWKSILLTILVGIAVGVGAWLHKHLILLSKLPIFSKIGKMFRKIEDIPFIGKLFRKVRHGFKSIRKILIFLTKKLKKFPILSKISKIFRSLSKGKILMRLLRGVKFGFKVLGWPLTLLLSLIDFIRGFRETKGPLFEKIKVGLWRVLEGFIELPVKFIGWVIEKVLGLFGVEVEGLGKKFMGIIKTGFMMILDGWKLLFDPKTWVELFGWIKDIAFAIVSKTKEWKDLIIKSISNIIFRIVNFLAGIWNKIINFMASKIRWIPGSDFLIKGLKSMQLETPITSPGATIAKAEGEKRFKINSQTGKIIKAIDDMSTTIKENDKKTGDAINGILNIQKGGNNTTIADQQQIPDEIDNNLISIANYGGE